MISAMKKRVLIIMLALVSVLMAFTGICGFNTAKAEGETALQQIEFTMIDGAQIRLDGNNGMRFAGQMSEADFNKISVAYETLEYGVFIMPEFYLDKGELNYANTIGGEKYFWDEDVISKGEGEAKTYRIIHMQSDATTDEFEDGYLVRGSVVDIKDKNLATTYVACAYIKATSAEGTVEYKFADMSDYTGRSILEVALRVKNTGKYEGEPEDAILDKYKTDYLAWYAENNDDAVPTYSYTINYCLEGVSRPLATETVENVAMNSAIEEFSYALVEQPKAEDARVYASNKVLNVYVDAEVLTGTLYQGEVAYLDKDLVKNGTVSEIQTFQLPKAVDNVNDFKIDGWEVDSVVYDGETQTVSVPTASLEYFIGGVKIATFVDGEGKFYSMKLTVADFVITNSNIGNMMFTRQNYYFAIAENIDAESVAVDPQVIDDFYGTIDGKGHVIRNYKISSWSGMIATGYLEGTRHTFSGTIKNIAFVNINNGGKDGTGYDGIFSEIANGATIENVYIHGLSTREQLFATIAENGVTIRDVILNFNDGYSYEGNVCNNNPHIGNQYNVFDVSTGEIIYEGVFWQIWNDESAFNNCAVGTKFGDFEMKEDGLYFGGALIKAK